MEKKRLSNIELLRIVSMIFVMLIHVTYALSGKTYSEVDSLLCVIVQWVTMICVDLFVLISGWFGIHFSFKGIGKLIYQTIFLALFSFIVCLIVGYSRFTMAGLWHCTLGVFSTYWFVWAYILLAILSPVLNAYVETATRSQFKLFLLLFYGFAWYAYFTLKVDPIFSKGFHTMSFIGIYLLGRYMRVYSPKWTQFRARVNMLIYLSSVAIAVIGVLILQNFQQDSLIIEKFGNYMAPTTIVGTIFFFLVFTKFSFYSKFVNWCAVSCFAAFIIHMQSDMLAMYNDLFQKIHASVPLYLFWPIAMVVVGCLFMMCVLIDKVRLFTWNKLFLGERL